MENNRYNPYIAGAPVSESKMFFGREDVFAWIQSNLKGKYLDHILIIHGQRRVGKTSVLKQLKDRLPPGYLLVFLDLQGHTNMSLERFLLWVTREIAKTLEQEYDIHVPTPNQNDFTASLDYFENSYLPELRNQIGEKTLLLTFDEFDALEDPKIKDTLTIPLIDTLKHIIGREGISFIFSIGSSGQQLENMRSSYTEFFKQALYKKITFLSLKDSQRLITEPVSGQIEYSPEAVQHIYTLTSGHPYYIQLICHELFVRCQESDHWTVTDEDVQDILPDVVERGTVNLKFVWDEANKNEKWCLAALPQLEGKATPERISSLLLAQQVCINDEVLHSALLHLQEKEILTDNFEFYVYLMKSWLRANRALMRVRDELVHVDPIVHGYLESGRIFREQKKYEEARASYMQALQVEGDNTDALDGLGLTLMDLHLYQDARNIFQKALTICSKDPIARAGYKKARQASIRTPMIIFGLISCLIVIAAIGFYQIIFPLIFPQPGTSTAPQNEPSEKPTVFTSTPTITLSPTATITLTLTPTPTHTITPTRPTGAPMTRQNDGMVMHYVPAGVFWMGADFNDENAASSSRMPSVDDRRIPLEAFWMDETEVTNAMYKKCVDGGGCRPLKTTYSKETLGNYPIDNVKWIDAVNYCRWAGGRLPTEAEWEKAARGVDGRTYPWGNSPPEENLLSFNHPYFTHAALVGQFPAGASPYGLLDMAGNVWEWTMSLFISYPYDANDGRNDENAAGERVARGGSWGSKSLGIRTDYRFKLSPEYNGNGIGFRCMVSAFND